MVYNYQNVTRWNGDLNRDGTLDDKFPVRCRLWIDFDDYANWAGTWPDHLQDPGSDPDTVGWQYDGDYIEGGAYAVDTGDPIYPMTVLDDPNEDDPVDMVSGSTGSYNIDLGFIILFGTSAYTAQLELNSATHGQFFYSLDGSPFGGNGVIFDSVSGVSAPDGSDYVATIHVEDGVLDTDSFTWPNMVTLAPGQFFYEDFDGFSNTAAMLAGGWQRAKHRFRLRWHEGVMVARWASSYAYNSYANNMVHANLGEAMGTYNPDQTAGNPPFFFYNYMYLQSPGFSVPGAASPYFMYRLRTYLVYYYSGQYPNFGWSSNGSVTQHYYSWNQRWYHNAVYVYQSVLYKRYAPSMTATTYLKFYHGCSNVYYTITTGAHLGSCCVMPDYTQPAGF